jgi:hypothetical protein
MTMLASRVERRRGTTGEGLLKMSSVTRGVGSAAGTWNVEWPERGVGL